MVRSDDWTRLGSLGVVLSNMGNKLMVETSGVCTGWRLYASSLAALQLALHGLCTPCAHAGSKKNDVKITIDDDFQNLLKQSVDAIGSMGISGLMGFCIAKALKVALLLMFRSLKALMRKMVFDMGVTWRPAFIMEIRQYSTHFAAEMGRVDF
jgi:hypothetical protein